MMQTAYDHLTNDELLRLVHTAQRDDLTTELARRLDLLMNAMDRRVRRWDERGRLMPESVYDALYGTLRHSISQRK